MEGRKGITGKNENHQQEKSSGKVQRKVKEERCRILNQGIVESNLERALDSNLKQKLSICFCKEKGNIQEEHNVVSADILRRRILAKLSIYICLVVTNAGERVSCAVALNCFLE